MSLDFILASGNQHKAQEFSKLFNPDIVQINPASAAIEVEEDGQSYAENALKKAQAYFDEYKRPVVSDDSGLNVEALPDELGIHSARFGGAGLSDRERVALLLEKLQGKTRDQRQAYFSCYLCFFLSTEEIYFFEGRLQGSVALSAQGDGGFGYDPIFIPEALERQGEASTLAQRPEWKAVNSHRSIAVKEAQAFFKERNGQRT